MGSDDGVLELAALKQPVPTSSQQKVTFSTSRWQTRAPLALIYHLSDNKAAAPSRKLLSVGGKS